MYSQNQEGIQGHPFPVRNEVPCRKQQWQEVVKRHLVAECRMTSRAMYLHKASFPGGCNGGQI